MARKESLVFWAVGLLGFFLIGGAAVMAQEVSGAASEYEPAFWPVTARGLAWPGAATGMAGVSASLGLNPASVVVAQRSFAELGGGTGWRRSHTGAATYVYSGISGGFGVQVAAERSSIQLVQPLVPDRTYRGTVGFGAAFGLSSGFGIGVSGYRDPETGTNNVGVSMGFVARAGRLSLGASMLNIRTWNGNGEMIPKTRWVLVGAGFRLFDGLAVVGDLRGVVRRQPVPSSNKPWSPLTRRLMWAPAGRFSGGLIAKPFRFLELAARYDLDGKAAAIGAELKVRQMSFALSVGKELEQRPLAKDIRGEYHSVNPTIVSFGFVYHGVESRREKTVRWELAKARKLIETRDFGGAKRALARAARLQPGDSAIVQLQQALARTESLQVALSAEARVENKGREIRRPVSGKVAIRSIARLDQLRKAFADSVRKHPPTFDPEVARWNAKPVNLGPAVNSVLDDFSPSLTVDERRLIFTSNRVGGIGVRMLPDGTVVGSEDFWMCEKIGSDWTNASNLGRPINTEGAEGAPCISADGQKIYFVRCGAQDGYGHCDIYVAELRGQTWSEPKNLGPAINTPYWEAHPSISSDGKKLFFAREDTTGINIWFSTLSDTGWTEAQKLGPEVNSPFNEVSPHIHADGKTLYFSSNRPGGFGGYDLYVSRWDSTKWTTAHNLGPWINTAEDDKYLAIPGAGNKGYFASSRPGGLGGLDIYEIVLPPPMRPKPVTTVMGKVLNALTGKPVGAEIRLRSLDTGEDVAVTKSNASTGEYLVVLPSAHVYSVLARAEGFVDYTERYEVKIQDAYREVKKDFYLHPAQLVVRIRRKLIDPRTGKPIPAQIQVKRLSDGQILGQGFADMNTGEVSIDVPVGGEYGLFYTAPNYAPFSERVTAEQLSADSVSVVHLTPVTPDSAFRVNLIFFDFDSDRLRPESTAELLQAVEFLQEYPDIRVEIQGHTDDVGPADYNLMLSQRRAEAVKKFLVEHGIDASRLIAKGYGETKPKVPNTSEENRAKNRRVEFRILKSERNE